MKGRKPKTKAEHKAQGNYRPSRHADRLDLPTVDTIPEAPARFDKEHKARWAELGKLLKEAGILASLDVDALAMYVELDLIRSKAHTKYLKSNDRKDFMTYREAAIQQKRMQDDFGFNPRARMAMKVEKPKEEKQDPVAELLKSLNN